MVIDSHSLRTEDFTYHLIKRLIKNSDIKANLFRLSDLIRLYTQYLGFKLTSVMLFLLV